jgi:hypothetical protein
MAGQRKKTAGERLPLEQRKIILKRNWKILKMFVKYKDSGGVNVERNLQHNQHLQDSAQCACALHMFISCFVGFM